MRMDHVACGRCCGRLSVLGGFVSWWAWTKSGMWGWHSRRLKKLWKKTKTFLQSINSSHVSANTSKFLHAWIKSFILQTSFRLTCSQIWWEHDQDNPCPGVSRYDKRTARVRLQQSNQALFVKQYAEPILSSTHLTTGVAKFPAAVEVWGSWHGVANASHADVSEGKVDDDVVGGRTQLLELDKHQQDHEVAG